MMSSEFEEQTFVVEGVELDEIEGIEKKKETEPSSSSSSSTPSPGHFRSSLFRWGKYVSKISEHLILLLGILLSLFSTVTSRRIMPSSTGTIGRGLGFVWKSFGNLRKAVKRSSSFRQLKLFPYSLLHTNDVSKHLWEICQSDVSDIISTGLFVCAWDVTCAHSQRSLTSFQSVSNVHQGLTLPRTEKISMNHAGHFIDDEALFKPKRDREPLLDLLDEYWEKSGNRADKEVYRSIDSLWSFLKEDKPEEVEKYFSHKAVEVKTIVTCSAMSMISVDSIASPAFNSEKKDTCLSSSLLIATPASPQLPHALQSSYSSSCMNLYRTPDATRGLLTVLEKTHWWCNNPFARYSSENAAQMHVVGNRNEDEEPYLVVGFRGSSTLRDLVADLRIGSSIGPLDVNIHRGFLSALESVDRDGVLFRELETIIERRKVKRVLLSGYSLGGAVASLFLFRYKEALERRGVDVRCVTFGCPRFVQHDDVDRLPIDVTSRIVHAFSEGDPIPLSLTSYLPWATRYSHVGHIVVLRTDGSGVSIEKESDTQKTSDGVINWSSPFGFHHHLCENYQKVISFAQLQLRVANVICNPLSRNLAKLVKQEKLRYEWERLTNS